MNAVDTNVLVRFLTNDDADQAARARRLFETESIYLPLTVLLETFWVLRKLRGLPASTILMQLLAITRFPNVTVEDAPRFERTLALLEAGMGFADALHLSAVEPSVRFATFDRRMSRAAQRAGLQNVFTP